LTCFTSHFHFPLALAEVLPQLPELVQPRAVRALPDPTPEGRMSTRAAACARGCEAGAVPALPLHPFVTNRSARRY